MSNKHQHLIDSVREMEAQHLLDEFRKTELAGELIPSTIELKSGRDRNGNVQFWAEAVTQGSFAVGDIPFRARERVRFNPDGSDMHHSYW